MKVGIAGAGAAGLATAWLLEETHDTLVLEARDSIGGNLRSAHLPDGDTGSPAALDLGVQEVPRHLTAVAGEIAKALGMEGHWEQLPSERAVVCDGTPLARSSDNGSSGALRVTEDETLAAQELLASQAAEWARKDIAWTVPLAELVEPWDLPEHVRDQAVYALPASLFGCTRSDARGLSARAVGAFYADPGPDADARTYRLRGGMQALAWQLARQCRSARIVPGTAVRRVRRVNGRLEMTDSAGGRHPVDAVVLALPAEDARGVVGPLGGTGTLRRLLGAYDYNDLVYGVHSDPCYLPAARDRWAPTTLSLHGGWAETTTWRERSGGDVFVSQLTHRAEPPRCVLASTAFRTLLPTPAMLTAQAELLGLQGEGGLYFAGHLTAPVDDLDSVLGSAVAVARHLAPDSPRLSALVRAIGEEKR
ncbi:FAD-dependent oxidoreductase [Streptomyces sp. NPDC059788]|uniref:FAD-dependent oxidoreductase n=1 Tax=Streptomyces sp. NPDC059788 TaxID=3346948 RepID=UPI0036531ABC